MGLLVGDFKES